MRTKGEIEAAISEEISRFEQDYMGRGTNAMAQDWRTPKEGGRMPR